LCVCVCVCMSVSVCVHGCATTTEKPALTHLQIIPFFAFAGGNPDSNTLIGDMTTVICLDDFHSLDRTGRSREKVTALDPKAQNFALMRDQVCEDSVCPRV